MKLSGIFASLFILGTLIALQPDPARAQEAIDTNGNFGIGVMVGEPTGISVKNWLSGSSAFDVGAAWSLGNRNEAIHLHADYLMHSWFADAEGLAFYYGIGGRVIFADDPTAGIRVPIGLNYVFTEVPFDLFVEAVPILDLTPDFEFAGNGAVGVRYYF